jgi:hypothetical protein
MFTAEPIRAKLAESASSIGDTDAPGDLSKLQRSTESSRPSAQDEDRLVNNLDKMIRSQDAPSRDEGVGKPLEARPLAEIEEHILRCLGAAVIMRWNTIPTKLQRELFDTAGSLGDVLQSGTLRGQIARFLHDHKDEEKSPDRIAGSHLEGKS